MGKKQNTREEVGNHDAERESQPRVWGVRPWPAPAGWEPTALPELTGRAPGQRGQGQKVNTRERTQVRRLREKLSA